LKQHRAHRLKRVGECLYRDISSDVYYAILWHQGRQIKKSLRTTDANVAKARRDVKRRELGQYYAVAADRHATFRQLGHSWLAEKQGRLKPSAYKRRLHCIDTLAKTFTGTLAMLSRDSVTAWANRRRALVKPRTFNMELHTLRAICRHALRLGIVNGSPVEHIATVPVGKARVQIIGQEDFGRFMAELRQGRSPEAARLIEFIAASGCRLNEALAVTWGDVDTENQTLTVTGGARGTKNRETRVIPLFPPLERLLASWVQGLPHVRLFSIQNAKTAIALACARAGIAAKLNHHTFRHCFATWALQAGVDVPTVSYWLGHKDGGVLVLKTYSHVLNEHSRAMARKLDWQLPAALSGPR